MTADGVQRALDNHLAKDGGKVEAIYRATLAIATELSLDAALQRIVDAARELAHARYAALGVVDEERRGLTRFVVSGMTVDEIRQVDHWPRGLGLLGELIHFPRPLRVRDISGDPRSVGFPPGHPIMRSFLGVPILRGGRILGNLYMTDKIGAEEFTEEDEEILSLFAAHAAIAIENARLYTETDTRLRDKVAEVERAERRSRLLSELGAVLLGTRPGQDPPLESVAELAASQLGDAVAIFIVARGRPDRVADRLVFHQDPKRAQAAAELLSRSWDGLRQQILHKGRSVLVRTLDGQDGSPIFDGKLLKRARFSAVLAVPISTGQATYGLLASLASRPLTLTEEDLRFATLIADRLGTALEAAVLQRRERESRARLQELAELAEHRASELEAVLDTIADAVYVVDDHLRLTRRNRAYDRLMGLANGDPPITSLQQHFQLLKPRGENGDPLSLEDLPAVLALRGENFTSKVMLITPVHGDPDRYIAVSSAPIRDATGRVIAAVNVARDITESRERDRLRDEFISVASHELKSPLTVVKGYAQILLQRLQSIPDRQGEARMARQILDQSNRMAALADRLLDVSRIQFGRLHLERHPVDLESLVRGVVDQMQVTVGDHRLVVSTEGGMDASIDAGRVEQVVVNLISNAAKYSPDGTEIHLSLRREDGRAIISVSDEGPGIPREQQPHIFRRFYRASSGEGKSGTGLGLYISKGIVEAHGGRIWFQSEAGKGTTFFVELPLEA